MPESRRQILSRVYDTEMSKYRDELRKKREGPFAERNDQARRYANLSAEQQKLAKPDLTTRIATKVFGGRADSAKFQQRANESRIEADRLGDFNHRIRARRLR